MTSGNGSTNGHTIHGLWRWLAVTMMGVVGVMAGFAWQNFRETQRSVTRELRQQTVKHEAELAALRERVNALEWYLKGRIPADKP